MYIINLFHVNAINLLKNSRSGNSAENFPSRRYSNNGISRTENFLVMGRGRKISTKPRFLNNSSTFFEETKCGKPFLDRNQYIYFSQKWLVNSSRCLTIQIKMKCVRCWSHPFLHIRNMYRFLQKEQLEKLLKKCVKTKSAVLY